MDDRVFDAFARRAAMALDRRSLLGLISGATLAAGIPAREAQAGKDPHGGKGGGNHKGGGGGKDKKDKKDKKCRKQATACIAAVGVYCSTQYGLQEYELRNLCLFAHDECCGLYRDCKTAKADRCIREVPY